MNHMSWYRVRQIVNQELSIHYQNLLGSLPSFLKTILLLSTGAQSLNFFFLFFFSAYLSEKALLLIYMSQFSQQILKRLHY